MAIIVDFENVSIADLESSPVSKALAGLRANESRCFKNKYNDDFTFSTIGVYPFIHMYWKSVSRQNLLSTK